MNSPWRGPAARRCSRCSRIANAGVKIDDPMMQRGMKYVREFEAKWTYVVGLQTMVLAELGDERDREKIQQNVDWLIRARVLENGNLTGWSYSETRGMPDNSNSQYAVLGLNAGRQAGAKIDRQIWESIRSFYRTTQSQAPREEGGWSYQPEAQRAHDADDDDRRAVRSASRRGRAGQGPTRFAIRRRREKLRPLRGRRRNSSGTRVAASARQARQSDAFRFEDDHTYYNCYGIERAGRLTGRRFLVASYDWYRQGCEFLVARQQTDDSWNSGGDAGWFPPAVETSFALLFLAKGRTPVLISKWTHGDDNGWNNKHSDAKHLVEYASRELFRRQPLAWQIYDGRELSFRNRDEHLREVGTLLQSPIVYMNGHRLGTMTDTQQQILKQYVEEGGFILAEACCGRAEFARDFRNLMAKLFPDHPLKLLGPEHAVWRSHTIVPPDFVKLEGVSLGCKTVVIFSPQPLSGNWEEDDLTDRRTRDAFRLAGNIIAYATGMEMPNVRLTPGTVTDDTPRAQRPSRDLSGRAATSRGRLAAGTARDDQRHAESARTTSPGCGLTHLGAGLCFGRLDQVQVLVHAGPRPVPAVGRGHRQSSFQSEVRRDTVGRCIVRERGV